MLPQEQRARRKVAWASLPTHLLKLPCWTTIGGPLPAHFWGAQPTVMAVSQSPSTQPLPVPQTLPQPSQLALSLRVSTQRRLQIVR